MRYIEKHAEPRSLTAYKQQPHAYYDGCNKEDIRKRLLEDQGYLCAYCMRRIPEEITVEDDMKAEDGIVKKAQKMKIEHWLPESQCTEQQKLDFHNMLGVCMGNAGHPYRETTCDAHRKDKILTINPLDRDMVKKIRYNTHTGEILSDDTQINDDLNNTLNLNYEGSDFSLPLNRRNALAVCLTKIQVQSRNKPGNWRKSLLQKMLKAYENKDTNGKYIEYSGIVIWYLRKKLGS